MSLSGRVVVITGATGGLGKVVAQQVGAMGGRLALHSTSAEKLSALTSELGLPGEQVSTHAVDLADGAAAKAAAASVVARYGHVDALVHLVGGWSGGVPLATVSPGEVESMLRQHVWTTLHLTQAFVPHLVGNGWGRVIAVSSPVASNPPAKSGPYAIAKAAEEALLLTLAQEVKGTGVTANVLQVRTIDVQHEREQAPTAKNASWTTPEEIATTVLYLLSDEAMVINGARIPLFGG